MVCIEVIIIDDIDDMLGIDGIVDKIVITINDTDNIVCKRVI